VHVQFGDLQRILQPGRGDLGSLGSGDARDDDVVPPLPGSTPEAVGEADDRPGRPG